MSGRGVPSVVLDLRLRLLPLPALALLRGLSTGGVSSSFVGVLTTNAGEAGCESVCFGPDNRSFIFSDGEAMVVIYLLFEEAKKDKAFENPMDVVVSLAILTHKI